MVEIPKDLADKGMNIARAEDYPVIDVVAKIMGRAAAFAAEEPLGTVPPELRDMVLGSVVMKLAVTILVAGQAPHDDEKILDIVRFYMGVTRAELLEHEREKAGGVQ